MSPSHRALALALALAGASPALAADPVPLVPPPPTPQQLAQELATVEAQLGTAEASLADVERTHSQRPEQDDAEARARRYSDAEIQYLLGNWGAASVLLYDLVSDPPFQKHPRYADALYFLADALFQQRNYIGARLYLRELLALPTTPRHKDALSRYLVIAGKLNQFDGIAPYLEQARVLSGGQLPPEVQYTWAKWLFRRTDLAPSERIAHARAAFTPLAQQPDGPYRLQAAYHLGVLSMQAGELPLALFQFQQLVTPQSPSDGGASVATAAQVVEARRIHELALMSLGRLSYETGRYDEALDWYGRVPQDSESFPESLYEIAWTQVRKGNHQEAKNAIDILLMVSPDSQLAPQARLLQGNLLQRLKKYDEAIATYDEVIGTFRPEREKVDALLRAKPEASAYFDRLLSRADDIPDVRTLLPPLARKYAASRREVVDAVKMVADIDSGREGTTEARELADRILRALDARGLETFPELQEGLTHADAVETALIRADEERLRVEALTLDTSLTQGEKDSVQHLRREREALRTRFLSLPTTTRALQERLDRMQARVDAVDREAFRLGTEIQGLQAIAASVRKWVDDTRLLRHTPPDEEQEYLVQLQAEVQTLSDLKVELDRTRARLADERHSAANTLAGEQAIRGRYAQALAAEHAVLAEAERRGASDTSGLVARAHAAQEKSDALKTRVVQAREALRARVETRGRLIREKVRAEQKLLERYDLDVRTASTDARLLVGRIAQDSVRSVRNQFYDLVLKADVGVVDVAFTEKQDKTQAIQNVAAQKADALRALDADFRDVLSEDGR
ncbi:tetratricopeptide repeat protein [Myxococcus sp. K15C18031901]|uniref:tetratricopeptide repeat protein n=1 Tax=Myxococcus dinghuensis TaxID=2906761 RepID=UPI0020A6DFF3|nr:tetratricopeptide repeat protein [Myxococcus dinghuensis]MCP3104173.1 tetratricopeptide repeat protein [Myxococcus dinghuensis]